jgi:hypothetical protein
MNENADIFKPAAYRDSSTWIIITMNAALTGVFLFMRWGCPHFKAPLYETFFDGVFQ